MSTSTLIILLSIGFIGGMLSGVVGIGGGIVIVPALVFLLGLSQHEAQGTSLFVLSMPVVSLALWNYWKNSYVNWTYGLVIAATFLIGGFVGSKLALKLSPGMLRLLFGMIMAYVAIQLVTSGIKMVNHEG
jgi:uncharacterized membrane protein YfcA